MTVVFRLRCWSRSRFNLRFRSWLRCWFYFRLRRWSWNRFNLRFWSRSWFWFYLWLRSWLRLRFWLWFIFTIHVFTLAIFICLPCNFTFFSITFSQYFKTCRLGTIRSNTYCTLKISFTIYIIMIIHLMSQVI